MLPAMATLAFTLFAGCDEVEVRRVDNYSSGIWYSDPYCGYGRGYGCGYYGTDRYRVRMVRDRRWNDGRGRRWHDGRGNRGRGGRGGGGRRGEMPTIASLTTTQTTTQATAWQEEFGMSSRAQTLIQSAFRNSIRGQTQQLRGMGLAPDDVKMMMRFELPSSQAIQEAAAVLEMDQQDLRDFLEVFLVRMKTAYQANEK